MRIDATNDSYAQGARFPVSGSAASYSDAMSTVMANDPGQLDFTNMTRQELMDWANGQFFSGKITTDELLSFMRMSIHGMRLHDENAP
ncbi:MAG: hypothetical protein LBS49_13410, partial [Candidatus Accumulibacter sp.]|nr:hypothetical protein [Accumulibacter sp.]